MRDARRATAARPAERRRVDRCPAYGNFPTIVKLLADRGADINIWKQADTEGRTPLYIAEGYKAGRPQPSRPTIDAIQRLMAAAGVIYLGWG